MTMPKFEPVAMGHFDFNGECHTVDRNIKATICVGGLSRSKKPLYTEDQLTEAYEAGKRDAQKLSVTLTGKEICELAEFAGLQIVWHNYADEYEAEITVETPSGFLLNDDGVEEHYRLIAYFTEEPEEGAIGLGDVLPAVQEPQINLEGYREAGSSLAGENGWDSRLAG
jgi:hypothetical protein